MLHLNLRLMFYFREQLKMYKNVKEKMHFILHLMIHSTVQSRGAPNDALTNLIKMHKTVHLSLHSGSTCGCTY